MLVNGSEIFVKQVSGNGTLSFVLIHNSGGNHHFFNHQIKCLEKIGNITLLDLPGNGQSQPIDNSTIKNLASIVSKICQKLSLTNICLVGLNNGANIAIEVALNKLLPIKGIVLLDPPIFMNQEFISEIENFILELEKKDLEDFSTSVSNTLFLNTNLENKQIAKNAFMNIDIQAQQKAFKGLLDWDKKSHGIFKKINYPTVCLISDEHHISFEKLKKEAPSIEIGKVVGSKSWMTLEVPEQVNSMIERFIKINFKK